MTLPRTYPHTLPIWLLFAACAAGQEDDDGRGGTSTTTSSSQATTSGFGTVTAGAGGAGGGPSCGPRCSLDATTVLDCDGHPTETCAVGLACSLVTATCVEPCTAARDNRSSVGCEYYASFLDSYVGEQACFVAIVANTSTKNAHIHAAFGDQVIDLATYARLPVGNGPDLTLAPYDPVVGLAPSESALLFLGGLSGDGGPRCRVPSAVPTGAQIHARSGVGQTFLLQTDVPVVAYQINPFGGASAAVTGASLLLPTSAWDTRYVGLGSPNPSVGDLGPMLNVVAQEDNTTVELQLRTGLTRGGVGVPPGEPGTPSRFTLARGEQAQILFEGEVTGNVLIADKPVGVFAGAPCVAFPAFYGACDHIEQMLPPASSYASRSVAVMPRPRAHEKMLYRVVALADGTELSYSESVGGPSTLDAGRHYTFETNKPFVVSSQDDEHPFILASYMTGGDIVLPRGIGDPDMVLVTPPAQYLSRYVFFADPTYSESTLVVVRGKNDAGQLSPVTLDCLGEIGGWEAVGDYEWARVDLVTGDFEEVDGCSTGRRVMESDAPFGLWVWGWATPDFSPPGYASYGYPAGMNVRKVNQVPVQVVPQ